MYGYEKVIRGSSSGRRILESDPTAAIPTSVSEFGLTESRISELKGMKFVLNINALNT